MEESRRTLELDRLALKLSEFYKGKVTTFPKVPVTSLKDFSYWYTPGVAAVSLEINKNIEESFNLTGRWNTVAILTDGTRVLGLGNVGPEASLPVMEGKALIFNYLGAVNAIPVPLKVTKPEEFLQVAQSLAPGFGAYNLEDIESPKCFYLLEQLQNSMDIPVWHDDQLGTACITLAGMFNALKVVGKKPGDAKVVMMGTGAANIATAHLLEAAGFKKGNMILTDSKGILQPDREDMDSLMINNPWKYQLSLDSNADRVRGEVSKAFEGADAVISASKSVPGTIHKDWISSMGKDSIVFALANPYPEIWPSEAIAAGARVVATGRSDFDNQINNSLVFPGVFRGVLDARARKVDYEVMVTASRTIAGRIEDPQPERIVPTMEDWELYPAVAASVATKCVELGYARKTESHETFLKQATELIEVNREAYSKLLNSGFIKKAPEV